jgi:hypothetical protein
MHRNSDIDLQTAFLNLLLESDPDLEQKREVASKLASNLAKFADQWATGSANLEECERCLKQQLDLIATNPAVPVAAADSGPEVAAYASASG